MKGRERRNHRGGAREGGDSTSGGEGGEERSTARNKVSNTAKDKKGEE